MHQAAAIINRTMPPVREIRRDGLGGWLFRIHRPDTGDRRQKRISTAEKGQLRPPLEMPDRGSALPARQLSSSGSRPNVMLSPSMASSVSAPLQSIPASRCATVTASSSGGHLGDDFAESRRFGAVGGHVISPLLLRYPDTSCGDVTVFHGSCSTGAARQGAGNRRFLMITPAKDRGLADDKQPALPLIPTASTAGSLGISIGAKI